ncbi:MAG: hypothetical protein JXX14_20900, partial [Deltaproteobacteria bacterium]|nr:hypothetical protein [Deltaproteobacteria bacterium]
MKNFWSSTCGRPQTTPDSPVKNLWHCLGACQAGGSSIDWVMRANGVAFRDAVGVLMNANAAGVIGNDVSKIPPSNGRAPFAELSLDHISFAFRTVLPVEQVNSRLPYFAA